MNQKIDRISAEIERTKAKIAELQELLPTLEERRTALENNEVIRLFRNADVKPGDFADFIEAYKIQTGIAKAGKAKEDDNAQSNTTADGGDYYADDVDSGGGVR